MKTRRKGWGMRFWAAIIAITLVCLAFGGAPSNAEAHAQYIRSQPAENEVLPQPPIEVLVWFTEAVELQFSEMQVINATGVRVDNDDFHHHGDTSNPGITLQPNLAPGTYTVAWRMLSAVDGHRTSGTFAFSVGQATGPPTTLATAAVAFESGGSTPPRELAVFNRWLGFAWMAALIGAVVFPVLVLPVGLRAIKAEGTAFDRALTRAVRSSRITILAALAVIAVTTAVSLWLQSWSATADAFSPTGMENVWTDTRFGEIWTLRVSVLFGALLLSSIAFQRLRGLLERGDLREPSWFALGICAFALPLTTSLNSHSAAGRSETELYVLSDWLHLVAGGIWIGGLIQLVLVSTAILSIIERRAAFLAGVIPRFSQVALVSVGIVVATGVFQWWHFLREISAAFDSDWGYTLFAKVTLLLPLLLLAAFNLLVVRPRFVSFVLGGIRTTSSRIMQWERRFRWAVAGEVGLAAVILVVAALLTETTVPFRGTSAQTDGSTTGAAPTPSGLAQSIDAGDLNIALDVYPGRAGPNEIGVFVNDLDGDERAVQSVTVRYKYLDSDLGENEDFAEPFHPPTHYILNTSQLSLAGSWQIEVIVRREGLLDARGTFTVDVQA